MESFRPLLPLGYPAGLQAYQKAVAGLTTADLSDHYTRGLSFFEGEFLPHLRSVLTELTGGHWCLDDFVGYGAGSDVDLMTHIVEAVASQEEVVLYPGDWHGFRVGATHDDRIVWDEEARGRVACLCLPSVRNGHFTAEMGQFLNDSSACLLNINLFPTLPAGERAAVARSLAGLLPRCVLSISFSRGFGLTASQLGVILIHREHPWRRRFQRQWEWFSYFHNALAARAFMEVDLSSLQAEDERRRAQVGEWLERNGLPVVSSGSYYVKSFRLEGALPPVLQPLWRDPVVRLCFRPNG